MKMPSGLLFRSIMFLCVLMLTGLGASKKMFGQDVKIHWGLAAPVAMKFQLLPSGGSAFNLWGNLGIYLVTIIEGTDENALSLLNKTGFGLDFTSYTTPEQGTLVMERASLFLNPEIIFPTNQKRLKVTGGFGVEWNGYFLAQLESSTSYDDNLAEEMNRKRRKIFPFVSAGLLYNLKNDFYFQLFIRQTMTGYFSKEAEIFFSKGALEPDLILNDKPTFAGLGISYFFNR